MNLQKSFLCKSLLDFVLRRADEWKEEEPIFMTIMLLFDVIIISIVNKGVY